MHSEIPAVVLYSDPSKKSNFILIKLDKNGIAESLKIIKNVWDQHVSNVPFSFNFLDDMINLQYQNDRKWGKIIGYSSSVAVFLACMGLFGLISLSLTKRVKEIGIRKVLGASVPGIVVILIREFTMLVLLANIFAWPLAYWAMNKWLQNFAYQVNISLWVFFLAGSLILIIALFTVSFQSVKSALANPAECLKYE